MIPRVSVVVPCYNQAHFLPAAIESILGQTFPVWEAILVDDGSTDRTAEVVAQYSDDRLRYFYQENRGLAGARNTGVRAARGELVALLDSDDMWEVDFLQNLVAILDDHPEAAAAYCGLRYIDEQGHFIGRDSLRVVPPGDFRRELMEEGNWLVPSAVVFRKRPAEAAGLFDETLPTLEDTDLWIRLSAIAPFIGAPMTLVRYRRHSANMTNNPGWMVAAYQRFVEKVYGQPDGPVSSWAKAKKAGYTLFYRTAIRRYLAAGQMQTSAEFLEKLVEIAPEYVLQMKFWREMARVHLPVEQRADIQWVNLKHAERDVCGLLGALEDRRRDQPSQQKFVHQVKGMAYVALAREAAEARKFELGNAWLRRAAWDSPDLLLWRPYWGTLMRNFGLLHG